jgi:hypothetical protein
MMDSRKKGSCSAQKKVDCSVEMKAARMVVSSAQKKVDCSVEMMVDHSEILRAPEMEHHLERPMERMKAVKMVRNSVQMKAARMVESWARTKAVKMVRNWAQMKAARMAQMKADYSEQMTA